MGQEGYSGRLAAALLRVGMGAVKYACALCRVERY